MSRQAMYPAATVELLPTAEYGGPYGAGFPIGLVEHVNAGQGDPFGWWVQEININPASAQWQVMKSGEVRQEVPADHQSWHNVNGIPFWHGMETEGQPWEAFTPQQMEAIAHLYAWGHTEWGWQLAISNGPWVPGFGWHGMGGWAWGGHFGCPGDLRLNARQRILNRAAQLVGKPVGPTHLLANEPTLFPGSTGAAVMDLQRAANDLGLSRPPLTVDGVYGPLTRQVVINVQRFFHLLTDGITGPQTWAQLAYCLALKGIKSL